VLEIDRTSRAARIQAGVLGPALEDQLRPHGLTLRHFPQSFEFSSLGGWIATRSGGHYATLYTHVDEFVESARVTPTVSWRAGGSCSGGGGPDRLVIGSRNPAIVEAWMRPPDSRSASVRSRATASPVPRAGAASSRALAFELPLLDPTGP
jgi:alkyldihydroxyacetonephosphate synthase